MIKQLQALLSLSDLKDHFLLFVLSSKIKVVLVFLFLQIIMFKSNNALILITFLNKNNKGCSDLWPPAAAPGLGTPTPSPCDPLWGTPAHGSWAVSPKPRHSTAEGLPNASVRFLPV